MLKLARSTADTYSMSDGKAGYVSRSDLCTWRGCDVAHRSFVAAWQSSMRIHETMAENKIRFAQRLNEMSEELANLAKEVDKNRKQVSVVGLTRPVGRSSPI